MPVLKYLDPNTGTYKPLLGIGSGAPVRAAYTRKGAMSFVASTPTPIPWDTVEEPATGISFSVDTFTIQSAGTYLITCALYFQNRADTGYNQLRIYKNGSLYDYTAEPTDDNVGFQVAMSRQMQLNVGDTIQINAYTIPAGALSVTPSYNTNCVQIVRLSSPAGGGGPTSPSAVWATGELSYWSGGIPTDTAGQPIYLDSLGQLRSRPQVFQPSTAFNMTSTPPSSYPLGMSVMSLSAAQATAGGWPGSGTVVTFRRFNDNVAVQWFYANNTVTPQAQWRAGNEANNPVWSAWLQSGYDSGWINLTPATGTGTFQYRILNGYVNIQAGLGSISIAQGANLNHLAPGGFPAAYRPTVIKYSSSSLGGALDGLAHVDPDGSIGTWNNSGVTATNSRFNFTYPIG